MATLDKNNDDEITKLYQTFKKSKFNLDFDEDLTKEIFFEYFEKEGIDKKIIQTIFNSIDTESNNYLSTAQYFQWQRKECTKRNIKQLVEAISVCTYIAK